MKIGFIGLGRMGKNMVFRFLEKGIEVVAWNRSKDDVEEVVRAGAVGAESLEDLVSSLRGHEVAKQSTEDKEDRHVANAPCDDCVVIWLMLPAGDVVDEFIDKLLKLLKNGDLIIDGANSFYKDTLRRAEKIKPTGVQFMDIGVSGGPEGARNGSCLMIGGSDEDFKMVESLFKAAAAPGAYQHLGPVGAGHFAKMIHNGIEYGMMESIAEGLAILKNGPFKYDFTKLLDLYNHGSVIESRLIGWAQDAFKEDPNLSDTSSKIDSTGEGDWTLDVAKEMGIETPAIKAAVNVRHNSGNDPEDSPSGFRNKVVSAMRGQFGQHAVKKT